MRPDLVLPALADQVADHLVAVDGDRSGELVALLLDLRAEVDLGRQQRLDRPVAGMALRQQARCALEMLVGKRQDLGPGHGT
jgi:hypothetical protein